MKQISFFTRGTMAALTKEEGGPLSCSASSHPTSVPRINPFHLRLCGGTTPELPNKGGRKAPPCPGGGHRGGGHVSLFPCGCPSPRCLGLSLSLSHQDLLRQVLPAALAARGEEFCVPLPLGIGVCRRLTPREKLHPGSVFTQGALGAAAS